ASNGKNGSSKNGAPSNTWAGAGRRGDGKIRVAIVGVGNCASSLVQGRYYYENAKEDDFVPGLMHVNLGGYHVRDIEFVAAFDFINAIPVFIGREPYWQRRFAEEGLPIIGDDIKSQVGATIAHRVLTRLFMDRGVRLDRTYQLNFGGNTDFLNMLERERLE